MGFFNDSYAGEPPWDIGRPQPAFVALAQRGEARGSILDVGCGTGENALFFAGLGHAVVGVDGAPAAIAKAREKAREREEASGSKLDISFQVHDALALGTLGRTFDTIIDSGLFHVFGDEDRARYVASLATVAQPGTRYFMLCFSERQPGDLGPRRVTQAEIRAAFADGWRVDDIQEAEFATRIWPGAQAWFSAVTRV